MTTRVELLDMVSQFLTEKLGEGHVTRRPDGIVIVAGATEAFALQALIIEPPQGVEAERFGEDLVRHLDSNRARAGWSAKLDD